MRQEDLEELFHLEKEMRQLEEQIYRIEKQSEEVADVVQNGYKRHAVIHGIDIKRKYKLEKNYYKLKEFKDQISKKHKEIEDYIENIPFSEIRQIFRYRFSDGLKLYQVALKMNKEYETDKYTDESVRKKIDRYLEKNL